MRMLRPATLLLLGALLAAGAPIPRALAAETRASSPVADRLFLAFAEDAAVVHTQWWEGQIEYVDLDPADAILARLVVALEPMSHLEVGGRVGFGSTDTPPPFPDGSGATDLDLWAKYDLGAVGGDTNFAVGGLVTIPTGDDTAGLGNDAFDFEAFGSLRHRLQKGTFTGHLGFRVNGDGRTLGFDLDGRTSALLGLGLIFPISDRASFVGEARMESERYRGSDTDFRVLGGVNWRPFDRGMLRGAVAVGVTDGAPDAQALLGYAYTF